MKKIFLLLICVCSFYILNAQTPLCTYLLDGNGNDEIDTNDLITNNVTYTTDMEGVSNKAALFNGTNSWAKLPDNIIPASISEFRLSLWFKTNGHQKGGGLAFAGSNIEGTFVTNYTPLLYIDTFGKLNTFMYDGSVVPIKSGAAVNDDQWHHAMVVYSINRITGALFQQLYLDGVSVAFRNSTISGVPLYNYVYIGTCCARGIGDVPDSWMYFNGAIDDVNYFTNVLAYDTWSNLMFKLSNMPASKTVNEGYTGSFTHITNTNFLAEEMIYTWKKGTTMLKSDTILGASSDSIDLAATVLTQAGNYTCEVTNPYGKTLISQISVLTVNDTSSTGTSVRNINDVNLITQYPNPVYDFIYLSNLPIDASIMLFSIDGQQINNLKMNENNRVIEVADLQKGVYVIAVKTANGYWNSKFIKE